MKKRKRKINIGGASQKGVAKPSLKGNKNAIGNNGGKPREYAVKDLPKLGQSMLNWAQAFIPLCEDRDTFEIPLIKDFAYEIAGISYDTLLDYVKDSPEFRQSYARVKSIQEKLLLKGGMKGWCNPNFTVFVAKNLTDLKDKKDLDLTSGGTPVKGFNFIIPTE